MEITVTDETDDTVEFDLEGVSPAFANALRRTMIGNVPTLAIEDVTVTANNSGLFDEILAHRLGLLPWEFDPDKYDMEADEDDPRGAVHMALQQEGPGAVTARDIAVPNDDVEPANPDAVIVELAEDASLDMEMTARLGQGKEHAKWQAANAAYAYSDDTFHFTVESVSGLSPRTIVERALDHLEEQVDAFEDAIGEHL